MPGPARLHGLQTYDFLDRRPSMAPPGALVVPGGLRGAIEVKGLSFAYPKDPLAMVLQDLTLTIQPGAKRREGCKGGRPTGAVKPPRVRWKRHFCRRNLSSPHVFAGQTVGFVGGSGCGKSSLFKLLQRIYLPASGSASLTVDGRELGDYEPRWLRQQVRREGGRGRRLLACASKQLRVASWARGRGRAAQHPCVSQTGCDSRLSLDS